jgi:hypothetical protein
MRRWRNITALFTTAIVILAAGLFYFALRHDERWIKHVNKSSVAIENQTEAHVEIVSLTVGGERRAVDRGLEAGEFTLLLGFFKETKPSESLALELVFRRGATGAAELFRHGAPEQHVARECDFRLVILADGVEVARSGAARSGSQACFFSGP